MLEIKRGLTLLDQVLRDDEMDLAVVIPLLDPPIQQALVFLHFNPVGRWSEGRDGKSLERVVITLRAGELLSGEGDDGDHGVEIWPSWNCGTKVSIYCSVDGS